MALSPATLTLSQGESGAVTVSTVLTAGTAQLVTLSVQNAPFVPPPGYYGPPNSPQVPQFATYWFAPPVINAGDSSTLTFNANNAQPGTYQLVIQAQSPAYTTQDTLTLIITPSTFTV